MVPLYFMISHALSEHGPQSMFCPVVTAGYRHDLHNPSVFNRQLPGEFTLHRRLSRIHRQLSEPDTRLLFLLNAFSVGQKVPLRVIVQHDTTIVNKKFQKAATALPEGYFCGRIAFTSSGVQGMLE